MRRFVMPASGRDYDVVIIGSGLLASLQPMKREGGSSVVILEKMRTAGGNSILTAVDSQRQAIRCRRPRFERFPEMLAADMIREGLV